MSTPTDCEGGFRGKALPLLFASVVLLGGAFALAQQTPPGGNSPEIAAHDEEPTFTTNVNLVPVTVVVRDGQGNAIGNLTKEDFQLFDNGKAQTISRFSVERPGSQAIHLSNRAGKAAGDVSPAAQPVLPNRFIAFLFDDIHLTMGDLVASRKAVMHYLDGTMRATDRAAILSASGRTDLDFTNDREKLKEALNGLIPRPIRISTPNACPNIDYYLADAIVNKNDQIALNTETMEVIKCLNLPLDIRAQQVGQLLSGQPGQQVNVSGTWQQAQNIAKGAAMQQVASGDAETQSALRVLAGAIRRASEMPGQRIVVLISPGFFTQRMQQQRTEIVERAARQNVVVNTLDARGLYTTAPDITKQIVDPVVERVKDQYERQGLIEQQTVMADLADGTGGTFFHNSNDLSGGIDRVAAAPEYYYLLGFAPRDTKRDGRFHKLRVALKNQRGWSIQARREYYALDGKADAALTAKEEIHDAVFSRDEIRDFPIALHARFFKSGEFDAKLTVLTQVGLRGIHFRKVDGRNSSDLTVVSTLFDTDGNYITGNQKLIEMRLRDPTLARLGSGLIVRTTFDVKTGPYVIRVVVRDRGDRLMAAANDTVEIP